ncbi:MULTISPECIES: hypothetical protein [unclassified Xanthomonas]|uniref:hypothetical protein n=1 Tax=Xanthomonas sp. LMG 8992 TaxID=1591157 RepID=UPI0016098517|nr:hypothetical protein [Xanthomonas sp. LMG 8992]
MRQPGEGALRILRRAISGAVDQRQQVAAVGAALGPAPFGATHALQDRLDPVFVKAVGHGR